MEAIRIGIREFREKLASYLLTSENPLAITRHGDTIGYYIPTRRKASEMEIHSLREAAASLQKMLKASRLTEDAVVEDFKRWRTTKHRS